MSSYPNAVFGGVNATNGETIYAADPNTLASEIAAVESTVGLNPQIESQPISGSPVSYSSLSARVSAAMRGDTHPYVDLFNVRATSSTYAFTVGHKLATDSNSIDYAVYNPPYSIAYQPPYANATTAYVNSGYITIRDTGLWYIEANQVWDAMSSPQGYVKLFLEIGHGNLVRQDLFNYGQFPTGGSNTFGETYAFQNGYTHVEFMGVITAGTTVRCLSGNSTPINPFGVKSSTLRAYMIRPMTAINDLEVG